MVNTFLSVSARHDEALSLMRLMSGVDCSETLTGHCTSVEAWTYIAKRSEIHAAATRVLVWSMPASQVDHLGGQFWRGRRGLLRGSPCRGSWWRWGAWQRWRP